MGRPKLPNNGRVDETHTNGTTLGGDGGSGPSLLLLPLHFTTTTNSHARNCNRSRSGGNGSGDDTGGTAGAATSNTTSLLQLEWQNYTADNSKKKTLVDSEERKTKSSRRKSSFKLTSIADSNKIQSVDGDIIRFLIKDYGKYRRGRFRKYFRALSPSSR